MFTGIVQKIGIVKMAEKTPGGLRLSIDSAGLDPAFLIDGASVSCSGCCLTVTEHRDGVFSADVSAETLSCTVLGGWEAGARVNIEPSLRAGDMMGGHIVSGHVDGLAVLEDIRQDGDSYRLVLQAPDALSRFIAPKGSVTLDGVSLTVNEVEGIRFGVNIIPHTWKHTTLGDRRPGDRVNLEIDVLARYAARILEARV